MRGYRQLSEISESIESREKFSVLIVLREISSWVTGPPGSADPRDLSEGAAARPAQVGFQSASSTICSPRFSLLPFSQPHFLSCWSRPTTMPGATPISAANATTSESLVSW